MEISDYRAKESRKCGWVCGTYTSWVIEDFERSVKKTFLEEELDTLFECSISAKELSLELMDMVKVLLHNTPKALANCYMSHSLMIKGERMIY